MNCNLFQNAAELNVIITKKWGGYMFKYGESKKENFCQNSVPQLTSRESFQNWLGKKFPTCMGNGFILYWIAVELELH